MFCFDRAHAFSTCSGTYTVNGKTRNVAIKQQKEDPNRDPKLKVMEGDFITEGHVQAGLNHPNVVAQVNSVHFERHGTHRFMHAS